MRGPKPKPTQLKIIAGNPGKRPLNRNEPRSNRKTPDKPVHLTGIASEFWDRLVNNLAELGILEGADEMAMERMALLYADVRRLQKEVDENGYTYESTDAETGKTLIKANPAGTQLRAADAQFKVFLTEFGLTPSSRTRIKTDKTDGNEEDEADRHFG